MSRKTQQARRKALNERKALKAIHRRDRQARHSFRLPPPRPTPHRTPVEKLDALFSGGRSGADPVTRTIRHLAHRFTSRCDRVVQFRSLLEATQRRIPGLMAPSGLTMLWRIADEAWVRPMSGWKPRGRITTTRLRSLIRHLLLRYPAPNFLLRELSEMVEDEEVAECVMADRLALLVSLGRGDSPRTAQRNKLLPAVLTKRMLHRLLKTPAPTLVHAIRKTQVATFDGSPVLAEQVCASFLGQSLQVSESFWQGITQWLCAQHMLDPGQIRPMLDYIQSQHAQVPTPQSPPWSIKGRTADSLIRDMEVWHARLNQIRLIRSQALPLSGFLRGRFEMKAKDGMTIWEVTEIHSEKALAAEGRAMRHCVFSYRGAVQAGRSSIWSMTCNGERMLTVEVENRHGHIVQVRGRSNRRATQKERGILARWATTARLTLKARALS